MGKHSKKQPDTRLSKKLQIEALNSALGDVRTVARAQATALVEESDTIDALQDQVETLASALLTTEEELGATRDQVQRWEDILAEVAMILVDNLVDPDSTPNVECRMVADPERVPDVLHQLIDEKDVIGAIGVAVFEGVVDFTDGLKETVVQTVADFFGPDTDAG